MIVNGSTQPRLIPLPTTSSAADAPRCAVRVTSIAADVV
jgi:hypothetical protein